MVAHIQLSSFYTKKLSTLIIIKLLYFHSSLTYTESLHLHWIFQSYVGDWLLHATTTCSSKPKRGNSLYHYTYSKDVYGQYRCTELYGSYRAAFCCQTWFVSYITGDWEDAQRHIKMTVSSNTLQISDDYPSFPCLLMYKTLDPRESQHSVKPSWLEMFWWLEIVFP